MSEQYQEPTPYRNAKKAGIDRQINDNKYGHSLQSSYQQSDLGLIGTPLVTIGGLWYEFQGIFKPGHTQDDLNGNYTRPSPFFGLFDGQNPLNWLWDTPGDLLGNTIGQMTSILSLPVIEANKVTFFIPGPNYSDARAANYPQYSGDESAAFWRYPATPGILNPWRQKPMPTPTPPSTISPAPAPTP